MNGIERLLGAIISLTALVGVATLLAMMALTVFTVTFRALGIAFPGTYVLAELLLIPTVAFALAYAAWDGSHTRVDLLTQLLSRRLAGFSNGLMLLGGTVFWGFVAYAGAKEAVKRGAQGETSPILHIPVAPFRWLMVAALVLLILVSALRALQILVGKEPGK